MCASCQKVDFKVACFPRKFKAPPGSLISPTVHSAPPSWGLKFPCPISRRIWHLVGRVFCPTGCFFMWFQHSAFCSRCALLQGLSSAASMDNPHKIQMERLEEEYHPPQRCLHLSCPKNRHSPGLGYAVQLASSRNVPTNPKPCSKLAGVSN
jgi:hypothetical protein